MRAWRKVSLVRRTSHCSNHCSLRYFCHSPKYSQQKQLHRQSLEDPTSFWGELATDIEWHKRPKSVLSDDPSSQMGYSWFADGRLNITESTLDRWALEAPDRAAIIHDCAVLGTVKTMTYAQLLDRVRHLAAALRERGIGKGDRIIIYMPMIPDAMVALQACARIGAIHSVVFGGFAAPELAKRLSDFSPRAIITASAGREPKKTIEYLPLIREAISLSPPACRPDFIMVSQRPELHSAELQNHTPNQMNYDEIDFNDALRNCDADVHGWAASMRSTDPLYTLYTSGTTGKPKGVVRECGGYAVSLKYIMQHFYDSRPGDVYLAASDLGWVVGHSFVAYGPLINGCTSVLFEGKPTGTPDSSTYWRMIQQHQIRTLFTSPTALRAIKKEDYNGDVIQQYDLSSLQNMFVAGERLDPPTLRWIRSIMPSNVSVSDHWWQTETGWPITGIMKSRDFANHTNNNIDTIPEGSAGYPLPGFDLRVVDNDHHPSITESSDDHSNDFGTEMPAGEVGQIVLTLPLPPGTLGGLWNDPQRMVKSYLRWWNDNDAHKKRVYATGDCGFADESGSISVMTRVDDWINVAGHRLSTGRLEEVVCEHDDVAECAVVGIEDELKGQVPMAVVVLKSGILRQNSDIQREVVAMVRRSVGPVACLNEVVLVPVLPKTKSGKILRRSLREIYSTGDFAAVPATIEDASALEFFRDALLEHRAKKK